MRSVDRAREFADMAGKAQTIDWLVENAVRRCLAFFLL
jgi:predicted Ser/Thr protein kinase